jgi:hypothetical protein
MINSDWSLSSIPPRGHADVGEFAKLLFDIAKNEKERLGKHADFLNYYAKYKGTANKAQQSGRKGYTPREVAGTLVNLLFANIERTVSNITARNPTGEVIDLDGQSDGSENILSAQLKKWWQDTDQRAKTKASARSMEIYGITSEKPYWDKAKDRPDIMLNDPFSFFPCPGNWEDLSEEMPYVCFAYVDFISNIEATFGVKDVKADDAYELMGAVREDYKPKTQGIQQTIGNYTDPMTIKRAEHGSDDKSMKRGLVIEVWLRDNRKKTERLTQPYINPETGEQLKDETGRDLILEASQTTQVYPDGVRKITITGTTDAKIKSGIIVLDDSANPNINPALPVEQAQNTYPWGRLPIYHANSYKDGVSIYGFAAAEQVSDLLEKINVILFKLVAYVINVMAPPLIVQKYCGITQADIESNLAKSGRLILMPTVPNARIEFMQIPNLPETFFRVLDLITRFFDRVYQIEDADRGEAPRGIIAASAIVALQERNQVLMQTKTTSIDSLVEQRSRWAIGLYQNFGTATDTVNVNGTTEAFQGVAFAGRKYGYVVEAGSTTPRTNLQVQEMATGLAQQGFIDRRALLEVLNFPGWKEIIERMGENQLDQALNILVQAGMPIEMAQQLKITLAQQQGGPGDTQQSGGQPKPGIPKAQQGA